MMKRKLLLGLGSLVAVAAPISAVVACGKIQTATDSELETYRRLTSSDSMKFFEEKWDEKVIKTAVDANFNFGTLDADSQRYTSSVANNALLKSAAQFIIKNEIAKDKQFITKIATEMQADQHADDTVLSAAGLVQVFENNKVYFEGDTVPSGMTPITNAGLDLLLNYVKSGFRLQVYKQIIAENYLAKTTLADFKEAFPREGRNLTPLQKMIKEDEFALTDAALSQKLFAEWNITLDADKSKLFVGKSFSIDQLQSQFTVNDQNVATDGTLAKSADNSVLKTRSFFGPEDVIANKFNAFAGFKGFVNVQAAGNKKLAFTPWSFENVVAANTYVWSGALQENDLVRADIKAIPENSTKVDVTIAVGVMPRFISGKLTFTGSDIFGSNAVSSVNDASKKAAIARLLAYKDSSTFTKAANFYRTKVGSREAIVLNVTNDKIKQIFDDANFVYYKERTAE